MPTARSVRWAEVEYQPNLQYPTKPIPLGIVAEEITGDLRTIVIVGREPRDGVKELQLEDAWGPFREVVGNWFENVLRTLKGCVNEVQPQQYLLDALAQRWQWNVYIKDPTNSQSTAELVDFAVRHFKSYAFPSKGPGDAALRKKELRPWIRHQNELQLTA